jgi:hypothetical protein
MDPFHWTVSRLRPPTRVPLLGLLNCTGQLLCPFHICPEYDDCNVRRNVGTAPAYDVAEVARH